MPQYFSAVDRRDGGAGLNQQSGPSSSRVYSCSQDGSPSPLTVVVLLAGKLTKQQKNTKNYDNNDDYAERSSDGNGVVRVTA